MASPAQRKLKLLVEHDYESTSDFLIDVLEVLALIENDSDDPCTEGLRLVERAVDAFAECEAEEE